MAESRYESLICSTSQKTETSTSKMNTSTAVLSALDADNKSTINGSKSDTVRKDDDISDHNNVEEEDNTDITPASTPLTSLPQEETTLSPSTTLSPPPNDSTEHIDGKSTTVADSSHALDPDILCKLSSQLEYYFSAQNLDRDHFLSSVMRQHNGYAPVSLLATFSNVSKIVTSSSVQTGGDLNLISQWLMDAAALSVDLEVVVLRDTMNSGENVKLLGIGPNAAAKHKLGSDIDLSLTPQSPPSNVKIVDTNDSATATPPPAPPQLQSMSISGRPPIQGSTLEGEKDLSYRSNDVDGTQVPLSAPTSPSNNDTTHSPNRNTIILRDMPSTTTEKDVSLLFANDDILSKHKPTSIHGDVSNCWFVTLENSDKDVIAEVIIQLRNKTDATGERIKARLKAVNGTSAGSSTGLTTSSPNHRISNYKEGRMRSPHYKPRIYRGDRNYIPYDVSNRTTIPKPPPPPPIEDSHYPVLGSAVKPAESGEEKNATKSESSLGSSTAVVHNEKEKNANPSTTTESMGPKPVTPASTLDANKASSISLPQSRQIPVSGYAAALLKSKAPSHLNSTPTKKSPPPQLSTSNKSKNSRKASSLSKTKKQIGASASKSNPTVKGHSSVAMKTGSSAAAARNRNEDTSSAETKSTGSSLTAPNGNRMAESSSTSAATGAVWGSKKSFADILKKK